MAQVLLASDPMSMFKIGRVQRWATPRKPRVALGQLRNQRVAMRSGPGKERDHRDRLSVEGPSRRHALLGGAVTAASLPIAAASAQVACIENCITNGREVNTSVTAFIPQLEKNKTVIRRRFTGVGDPSWTFPVEDVTAQLLKQAPPPDTWPYTYADFKRQDNSDDKKFYPSGEPKLFYHIDEGAVAALTHYYDANIKDGSDILDICSSWLSHYPRDFPSRMRSITGTGMNTIELSLNDQLTRYDQLDLNYEPEGAREDAYVPFEYKDASFDVVTCVVSYDYLRRPREVMKEIARMLRPGGKVIISQSNRCFFQKAVKAWTTDMSDGAHLRYLCTVLKFTPGDPFKEFKVLNISPKGPGTKDPMYIIEAVKKA